MQVMCVKELSRNWSVISIMKPCRAAPSAKLNRDFQRGTLRCYVLFFLLFLCKEEIHLKRIDLLTLFIGNLLSFQGDQLVGEQLKNAERKMLRPNC